MRSTLTLTLIAFLALTSTTAAQVVDPFLPQTDQYDLPAVDAWNVPLQIGIPQAQAAESLAVNASQVAAEIATGLTIGQILPDGTVVGSQLVEAIYAGQLSRSGLTPQDIATVSLTANGLTTLSLTVRGEVLGTRRADGSIVGSSLVEAIIAQQQRAASVQSGNLTTSSFLSNSLTAAGFLTNSLAANGLVATSQKVPGREFLGIGHRFIYGIDDIPTILQSIETGVSPLTTREVPSELLAVMPDRWREQHTHSYLTGVASSIKQPLVVRFSTIRETDPSAAQWIIDSRHPVVLYVEDMALNEPFLTAIKASNVQAIVVGLPWAADPSAWWPFDFVRRITGLEQVLRRVTQAPILLAVPHRLALTYEKGDYWTNALGPDVVNRFDGYAICQINLFAAIPYLPDIEELRTELNLPDKPLVLAEFIGGVTDDPDRARVVWTKKTGVMRRFLQDWHGLLLMYENDTTRPIVSNIAETWLTPQ